MPRDFLPVTAVEMKKRGWDRPDFVYVTGDAYVDHPSFGLAVISRVLEKAGYKVAMLPQPNWKSTEDFMRFGEPKLGFLVTAGVIDSMVNHYTAAKKTRSEDAYSPGGKAGHRPDRATIVYCNRIREAYKHVPILIGGVEASLRRFAHYDYWDDRVRNSMLVDSGADMLLYGMGERVIIEAAKWIESKKPIAESWIEGTCIMAPSVPQGYIEIESMEQVSKEKKAYAKAFRVQYDEQDPVRGRGIAQKHGARYLVQHMPAMPLAERELDATYSLPFMRTWHPMYDDVGGIPALTEVEFSIAATRGCFGACNFCALTFHQGRIVTSRSQRSIVEEGRLLTHLPGFKGYIHDVGGPTANFRQPACRKQLRQGTCKHRQCLYPKPCPHLEADHSQYLSILRELRELPGVKKVFIRSGIRYDYLLKDKYSPFLKELVEHHISGQLKIAPEHISPNVLEKMGKPGQQVFEQFRCKYQEANEAAGKKQYLVPYFMSSHPGSTLADAVELAVYLKKSGLRPEQVQDFYPPPGTLSTAMFHTGIDPRDMSPVYVAKDPREKALQRALMQYYVPKNRDLVIEALRKANRTDLIGFGQDCLIGNRAFSAQGKPKSGAQGKPGAKPQAQGGQRPTGKKKPQKARQKSTKR